MKLWIFFRIFNYHQVFRYTHFCLLHILWEPMGAMILSESSMRNLKKTFVSFNLSSVKKSSGQTKFFQRFGHHLAFFKLWNFFWIFNYDQGIMYTHFCWLHILWELMGAMVLSGSSISNFEKPLAYFNWSSEKWSLEQLKFIPELWAPYSSQNFVEMRGNFEEFENMKTEIESTKKTRRGRPCW